MKKTVYRITFAFSFILFAGAIFAQEIRVEGTKFVYPIVEKWLAEYKKENPKSTIRLEAGASSQGEKVADLSVIVNSSADDNADGEKVVYVGRYALLPVSNVQNPLLEKAAKGLKKRDLIDLVFEKDALDEDFDPEEKSKYTATIYSRNNESSTTLALAEYFGQTPERIKGKKILGDEIYLITAVQKDEKGIAFNTLNYVFDLNSRQLKSGISLVPLQLKTKQKEALESDNIDNLISLLEESKIETIPVENFGLQISKEHLNNKDVVNFVKWILVHGQKYNHEYGFLNLDSKTLVFQKEQLDNNKEYLSYTKNY
ncbi:MAG: substrate-binding domain-containing protein [Tannerella sp.]|jgi:ABC-type phosphate transport system substrate-binding protein|nr:substrate-binding domain-containing protein [Tannerella sp.]